MFGIVFALNYSEVIFFEGGEPLNTEKIVLEIIICSGNARSYMYEALEHAKNKDFLKAEECMSLGDEEMNKAHDVQTSLLQQEAAGVKIDVTLLFVHSQDHIMTTLSQKHLIQQIIDLRKELCEL